MTQISVITICFNDSEGLERTINSVLNQKNAMFEYVVVDGGSTDGTPNVLSAYASSISKYISESDDGIYDAMNKGVDLSTGDYLIFLNAGDTFVNENVISSLQRDSLSGEDVLYGDHVVVGARRRNGLRRAMAPKDYYKGMFACHQSILFKKSCFVDRGFSELYGPSGDYEFILFLMRKNATFRKLDYAVAVFSGRGLSDNERIQTVSGAIKAMKDHGLYSPKAKISFLNLYLRAILFRFFVRQLKINNQSSVP